MGISKWKAGIWFMAAANTILAPIGLIASICMTIGNKVGGQTTHMISQNDITEGISVIIGYALCVFLAVVLYKSEKKKCNNNKAHMKLFVKVRFKSYLKVLFIFFYIWFWLVGKLLGVDKAVAMKNRKYPEYVEGKGRENYKVLMNASNKPYIYVNGEMRNLRDMGGYYQDDYGETYSYD